MAVLTLVSCEKEHMLQEDLGENSGVVGTWVESGLEGEVKTLTRATELDPDRYGFIIKENGTFTERKNAGWCGTPPITYGEFDGTWTPVSDSLLGITVGYWGGTMTYQLRVVSVSQETLTVRYLYAENLADSR